MAPRTWTHMVPCAPVSSRYHNYNPGHGGTEPPTHTGLGFSRCTDPERPKSHTGPSPIHRGLSTAEPSGEACCWWPVANGGREVPLRRASQGWPTPLET